MTTTTPPPPQSIDDLRAALLKDHGATVSKDDPVLMVYTIHRAALGETVQALDAFRTALRDDVAAISRGHTAEVRAALAEIHDAVTSDALKQRLAAMQEAAVLADRSTAAMRRLVVRLSLLSLATGIAATLAVAAAVLVLR